MNILYIDHYAGSPEMGMEFRPYYLSREWVKMGHRVTIIAGDYSHLRKKNPKVKKDFQREMIDGIEYCWLITGTYKGNGVSRAMTMRRFTWKLFKNAKEISARYRPDVVIASSTYPLDAFPANRIAKIAKAKYIHEVHDMWPATLYEIGGMSKYHPFVVLMQIAENYAYRHCDECVSLAPYTKKYMVQHGLKPEKWHNIQNGVVEEEWENPEPIPEEHRLFFENHKGKFIAGYFGGHALSNALDYILDAAKDERLAECVFVFVGQGVEKEHLIKRTKTEKINNAFFLPPVKKSQVPDLVRNFDCSMMSGVPSPLYRFGLCVNKMYDSMMAGKPIVLAINAPKTLIEQYGCGVKADPSIKTAIADALLSLISETGEERQRMGDAGKSAVCSFFTYNKLAEEFIGIVQS